jgi:DNA-binding NarL/FixJ family response regulator
MTSLDLAGSADRGKQLSSREAQVLALVAEGLTNGQIAERLELSVHSIKFHLAAVFRKLDVSNRTEAAAMFFRAGSRAHGEQPPL